MGPERRFAIEGARGLGRGLAQQLAAAGQDVVDVPSILSARARLLATGGDRKTDAADALQVAQVALFRQDLHQVPLQDQSTILRLLTERRDDRPLTPALRPRSMSCWARGRLPYTGWRRQVIGGTLGGMSRSGRCMSRKTLFVVTISVAVAAAATVLAAAAARGHAGPADKGTGVVNTRSPGEVSSYWTDERMRDASPG